VAAQFGAVPPAKVMLTCCGVVISVPFVPQVNELGNTAMVTAEGTVPACVTVTVCPATVKDPILLSEPLFAVTDQLTLLPETEADAHETLELAATAPQVLELGVTVMPPDEAAAPTFNAPALKVKEQGGGTTVLLSMKAIKTSTRFGSPKLLPYITARLSGLPIAWGCAQYAIVALAESMGWL